MSGYVRAVNFVKNLVKGKKTSPTIVGTTPNVGNLKKNKETFDKLKKITDTYVVKAGKVDPGLKKALRDSGSKSLQKTDNILRRNKESKKMFKTVESKKDGGRMGLKFGGGADKQLSSKQMKIASLAGNKKKIDGPDFKKLRAMKSPISKSVKKA
jgi:hypothetical protein